MPGTHSQMLPHIVFSTKHREPWITADVAERLYPDMGGIVRAEKRGLYDIAVIDDHVNDENNDGAADIEDVKLFLKKNKANRIALKGNDQYPGGDFRSPECVDFLKQADIVVTNPPFSLFRDGFNNSKLEF